MIFPAIATGKTEEFGEAAGPDILLYADDAAQGKERVARHDDAAIVGRSFALTDNDTVDMVVEQVGCG